MKAEELEKQKIAQTGELLFEGLEFHEQLKTRVNQQIRKSVRKRRRNFFTLASSVAVLCLGVALWHATPAPPSPAPAKMGPAQAESDFRLPIKVQADAYPMHNGQKFNLVSEVSEWSGTKVNVYVIPDTETNSNALFAEEKLPAEAKLIGTTPIQNGVWIFQGTVPNQKSTTFGSFLIAVQSDQGEISGRRVQTLPYEQLALSASDISANQSVVLRGGGFPPNLDIKVDLLKDEENDNGTTIASLGIIHTTENGSFEMPIQLSNAMKGQALQPGNYVLNVVTMPTNQAHWGITVPVLVHP